MTAAKAKALALLGLHVFPVAHRDMPKRNKRVKEPLPLNGLEAGTTSPRKIDAMWQMHPDAWVGVWCGPSGIIVGDIDEHDGAKDGRETLRDHDVTEPETYSYGTLSGHGRHYIYAGPDIPNGKPFGPSQGVDRQSGNSYVIWHGPVPASRDQFAPAPNWLLQNVGDRLELEKINAEDFISALPNEDMGPYMKRAFDRVPDTEFGRNDLYRRSVEIASLHFEGHAGAKEAFVHLAEEWLRGEYNTETYRKDLLNTVGNAIAYAKVNAAPDTEPTDEASSPAIPVDEVAVRVISHTELMQTDYNVEWLIDGLLPSNGLGLLTGRSNVGKTTVALQLAATLASGRGDFLHWKIPAPRRRKVLFLSLELESWGMQQFAGNLSKSFPVEELDGNLAYYPLGQPMLLSTKGGRDHLLRVCDEAEPTIIVIDSLGETCRNLQDEAESAELFDFFKWLKNHRVATVTVHHHRKVTSENAGRARRLNDLSDVYGSVAVTKQPDMILDIDDQRSSYSDPKGEIVQGEVAMNLLKVRYSAKWKHPMNLTRDQYGHFSLAAPDHVTQDELDAVAALSGGTNLFGIGA
jgi:archaellum biogenesis ATPase FlaH